MRNGDLQYRFRQAERRLRGIDRFLDIDRNNLTLIGNLAVAGKTLNNYLIPLRGVFEFARRDGAIVTNPAHALENARVQEPAPDPFTLPEVVAILDGRAEREDSQIVGKFAAAFFGGFRPSERIALRWADVDFQQRTVRVQRAMVRGRTKDSTKTYLVRDVELSDRAWTAIESQRAHMQLAGKEIFWNPATGEPWADIQSQRRIWQRGLKRLGLRYREPYQTPHTFATLALTAGANPRRPRAPKASAEGTEPLKAPRIPRFGHGSGHAMRR
jgi:integrase